jgi:predicted enzyme related to lactoylglutathione lyase
MAFVTWFEIPVVDLDRAIDFYEHVLEVELERTVIDGHPMALFPDPDDDGGASGSLATGDSYIPSLDGSRVYFRVIDVAATLQRAIDRGGRELYPVTDIGAPGLVAEFQDSEGNRIALSGPNT